MIVATHHAGSPVVVWKTSEHYIDVRISPAAHYHSIEIVRNGRVMLHEDQGDTDFQIAFDCYAEDDDHAAEQAMNAYPCGEVLSTIQIQEELK